MNLASSWSRGSCMAPRGQAIRVVFGEFQQALRGANQKSTTGITIWPFAQGIMLVPGWYASTLGDFGMCFTCLIYDLRDTFIYPKLSALCTIVKEDWPKRKAHSLSSGAPICTTFRAASFPSSHMCSYHCSFCIYRHTEFSLLLLESQAIRS